MLPSYNFICIPLDTRDPASESKRFAVQIVTEIQFPTGVPHDPTSIREVLNQHPLLIGSSNRPISALVWSYRQWSANGKAIDPHAAVQAAVRFTGTTSLADMHRNLLNYMGRANETITTKNLPRDGQYEKLSPDDFVHVTQAADNLRLITNALKVRAFRSLAVASGLGAQPDTDAQIDISTLTDLETTSIGLAKWVDGAIHSSLLKALHPEREHQQEQSYAPFASYDSLQEMRRSVEKILRRITVQNPPVCPLPEQDSLALLSPSGTPEEVDLADPNVAIHSGIKNSLLASACGFVTSWSVESDSPIYGAQDYVIQLDVSSLTSDSGKIEVKPSLPTAFRRVRHTHPVSYGDLGSTETHNCALACLNDGSGGTRYRATCVNAEAGLVKQVILQAKNSLSGPSASTEDNFGRFKKPLDDRAAQLLRNDRYGTPEPETAGVVFSAPPEDLTVPNGLRFASPEARQAAMPCLFLEDLWVGYRLDLKEQNRQKFTSIHQQNQEITLAQTPAQPVSGSTEDYIEREQRDAPSAGYSSSDLITYTGLSSGQAKDYLVVLGVSRVAATRQHQPFTVKVSSYGQTERLAFGNTYEYRFRNVFIGGVSCKPTDVALDSARFSKNYRQQFPFFRARTLRPGEVLNAGQQAGEGSNGGGRTIYLTAQQPRVVVTLVPSPIDVDSSRFHGLLFVSKEERKSSRKHVTDLGKFFKTLPPSDLDYFYDPDVYGVIIRAKMVNGDERVETEGMTYTDGTYCKLAKHLSLSPTTEIYGQKGDWRRFKPIVITFHTAGGSIAEVKKGTNLGAARHIDVFVPPAAELHLSLLPMFDPELKSKTASFVASSAELQEMGANFMAAASLPLPAVAEQKITVIHAVKGPRLAPRLICDNPRRTKPSGGEQEPCVAARELDSEFGRVIGRVELDAASTKEVRLEAAWTDVNDDLRQERYVLETGTAVTTPRSVVFREFEIPYPSAANFEEFFLSGSPRQPSSSLMNYRVGTSKHNFTDQFALQCVEDKVFLGQMPEEHQGTVPGTTNQLDFKDQRRKVAQVHAVAVGRFAQMLASAPGVSEQRSNSVTIDVPSTLKMSAPRISHIVPIRRELLDRDDKFARRAATFGVRVYLRKQCFQSGVGERLAIGCATGGEPQSKDGADILKYVTQWGEDPIERAGLTSTKKMPRASDFIVPEGDVDSGDFDENLYPANIIGGRAPVIYRDNIPLAPSAPEDEQRWVSVASYALRYDKAQRLWYADVQIGGDFFGRCAMALYRHQPHAVEMRELSPVSTWVYAAILYGEPVAWLEDQNNLHVTIGPVYDANVSFELDSLKYGDGISEELYGSERVLHPLKSYRVGKAFYFEAVVPKKHFSWSLFKKRFGYPVASGRLRE